MTLGARTGAWSGKRLPYDAEVEYLESTGAQWIDTELVPLIGDNYYCVFSKVSLQGTGYVSVFGGNNSWSAEYTGIGLYGRTANSEFYPYYFNNGGASILTIELGRNYSFAMLYSNKTVSVMMDGSEKFSFQMNWKQEDAASVYLFARNLGGTVAYQSGTFRICSFSVERDGKTELDLIPVRKDGVGYMYDRVSGKLFGNIGTGSFVIGPDK